MNMKIIALAVLLALTGCGQDKGKGTGDDKSSAAPKAPPGKFRYPVVVEGEADGKAAGYIDEHGAVVIAPAFAQATWFSEGLAQVKIGELWGYIDETGKLVIPAKFKQDQGVAAMPNQFGGNAFNHGAAIVRDPATDKQIVIDKTGATTWVVDGTLSSGFDEGLALYDPVPGHAAFVDPTGKVVIDDGYTHAQGFSEGLAAVEYIGSWTYIDRTGKRLDQSWYLAQPFHDGRALVWEGSTGPAHYIDKTGAVAIAGPLGGESSRSFSSGVAYVVGAERGWIDPSGKIIPALASYDGLFNGPAPYTMWVGYQVRASASHPLHLTTLTSSASGPTLVAGSSMRKKKVRPPTTAQPAAARAARPAIRSAPRKPGTALASAKAALGDARAVVGNARDVVRNATAVVRNARSVVRNARAAIRDSRAAVADSKEVAGSARAVVGNAKAVVRNTKAIVRNAKAALGNVRAAIAQPRTADVIDVASVVDDEPHRS